MAQERFPRYDEQVAAGEAGQAYAYEQPELIRRLPQEEILTDCQDSLLYLATKRVLDIVMSVGALVVLSPLLLAVAAIIYIDDPHGGPIFVQDRVGKNGKRFRFLNLRWMKTIDNSHRECAAKRPVSCATRTTKRPERGFRHRSGHFRPAAAAESGAFRRPSEPAPIHRTA